MLELPEDLELLADEPDLFELELRVLPELLVERLGVLVARVDLPLFPEDLVDGFDPEELRVVAPELRVVAPELRVLASELRVLASELRVLVPELRVVVPREEDPLVVLDLVEPDLVVASDERDPGRA